MARTIRRYPQGVDMIPAAEAQRDGHHWHEPGERYAKKQSNRASRRHWLTNRERAAAFARIAY